MAAAVESGPLVALRLDRLCRGARAAGAVRAGLPASALLRRAPADARERCVNGWWRWPSKAGTPVARRLRMASRRSHDKSQRRARRHRPHAPHPRVRHAAGRAFRRRDRDGLRARARASRLRGHLVGAGARDRRSSRSAATSPISCSRRLRRAFGLEGKGDVAGLPLIALTAGRRLARADAGRRMRSHARTSAGPIATRWRRRGTRRVHQRDAASCRDATSLRSSPSRFVEVLFHTHPSTTARIEAARRGLSALESHRIRKPEPHAGSPDA